MKQRLQTKAFTLIELLVVIGLIVVLAGGIGLAFSGGDKANALHGAQGTLQSLVSAVRGQAALAGRDAALFVNADADDFDTERYLRTFIVAVKNTAGDWEVVGDEISLPSGIYLLPPPSGSFSKAVVAPDSGTYQLSDGFGDQSVNDDTLHYPGGSDEYPGKYALVLILSPRGTRESSTGGGSNLVLSPAEREAERIVFKQPDLVRGAIISRYGILTPINDAAGFED